MVNSWHAPIIARTYMRHSEAHELTFRQIMETVTNRANDNAQPKSPHKSTADKWYW